MRALLARSLRRCSLFVLVLTLARTAHGQQVQALLLFGGEDHKTFLGCLNCGKFDSGSVCNKFGEQGSKFSAESIWNKFGEFGSKFSNLSPWNRFGSDPPVIVDADGAFYGHLTANKADPERTQIKALRALTDVWSEGDIDLATLSDRFCGRE